MRTILAALMLLATASSGWAATAGEIDAAIEQAYLDRYGAPRTEAQLTDSSKAVWVQNILIGTVPWPFNECGPVWSIDVLRCSIGLVPSTAPIQQSFGAPTPPPVAPVVPPAPTPLPPVPTGPDETPALDAAVSAACAGDMRTIRYSAGVFRFASPPRPFPCGIWLVGEGKGATLLQRDYSGDFLRWVGGQEGGGGLEKLAVYAGPGTSGGSGVLVIASAAHLIGTIAGAVVLRDVIVSGVGMWDYAVQLDGSQRQDCTNACGIRVVHFSNVHLFQSSLAALRCEACVAFEWFGGGAYGPRPDAVFVGGTGNYVNADIQGYILGATRQR